MQTRPWFSAGAGSSSSSRCPQHGSKGHRRREGECTTIYGKNGDLPVMITINTQPQGGFNPCAENIAEKKAQEDKLKQMQEDKKKQDQQTQQAQQQQQQQDEEKKKQETLDEKKRQDAKAAILAQIATAPSAPPSPPNPSLTTAGGGTLRPPGSTAAENMAVSSQNATSTTTTTKSWSKYLLWLVGFLFLLTLILLVYKLTQPKKLSIDNTNPDITEAAEGS